MNNICTYSHRQIGDAAWTVTESLGRRRLTIGVIAGLEKIAVINAGLGLTGDLRKYIETFTGTDRPMVCWCTDGAPEHTGGAGSFDAALVSSRDAALLGTEPAWLAEIPAELLAWGRETGPARETPRFRELRPGFEAIGRQHIAPRPLPGHTEGSFVLLNMEGRLCFLGDALGPEVTELPCLDREGFARYAGELRRLTEEFRGEARFWCSGSERELDREYVLRTARCCDEIAAGQTAGDVPLGGGQYIHTLENASVLYSAERLGR